MLKRIDGVWPIRYSSSLKSLLHEALQHLFDAVNDLQRKAARYGLKVEAYAEIHGILEKMVDASFDRPTDHLSDETVTILKAAAILFLEESRAKWGTEPDGIRRENERRIEPLVQFAKAPIEPHTILEEIRQAGISSPPRKPIGFA